MCQVSQETVGDAPGTPLCSPCTPYTPCTPCNPWHPLHLQRPLYPLSLGLMLPSPPEPRRRALHPLHPKR